MINLKKKIIFIFITFSFLFFLILIRAFQIQIINKDKLIAYSNDQTIRVSKVYPHRGNIYDRNGSPLAINVQTYSIFTIPKNIKEGNSYYKNLSRIVPHLSYSKILNTIKKRKNYTWVTRKISLTNEQVEKIKELQGIYIEAVPKRLYPNKDLLSQTLGFVGVDNVGLAGLEYLYNEELKGKPKVIKYFKDAKGRPIKFESQEFHSNAKDLFLSIDKELQSIAERELKNAVIENEASSGGIGIMNPQTGEILAVANYPSYDSEKLNIATEKDRKLSFISNPFEPGSILKTITAISALENNTAKPDTNYYCERGQMKVQGHIINEAEATEKFEWLSLEEIIKLSSNVGITKVAFDLTFPRLKTTLELMNFGQKTGIELPGESRGIFTYEENIQPLSLSNISFGQGIAVTGIQILVAYSAIANGGLLVTPTIFKKEGPIESVRVMKRDTAEKITKMLTLAVDEGTGTNAKIIDFKIAGKTSTAQRVAASGGYHGYVPGFVGFPVGVENTFVIFVYIDSPTKGKFYGNAVAAPVFKNVAKYILYKNKEYQNIARTDKLDNLEIIDQVKKKDSSIRIKSEDIVPNFIGLDKFSAKLIAEKLNITVLHQGMGIVKNQFPIEGQKINDTTIITLKYEAPEYE